jgi:hypothetical protein
MNHDDSSNQPFLVLTCIYEGRRQKTQVILQMWNVQQFGSLWCTLYVGKYNQSLNPEISETDEDNHMQRHSLYWPQSYFTVELFDLSCRLNGCLIFSFSLKTILN